MDFRSQFKLFFESDKVKDFIQFFNSSIPVDRKRSLSYFGVNFSDDILTSIKLYYTFFAVSDINEVKNILPTTDEFDRFFSFYKEGGVLNNQDTGCAFTLKANSKMQFTKGFHFRFPVTNNVLFEPPRFIELTEKDMGNYQGISFEYSDSNIVKRKHYYYITDRITIRKIAEEWQNPSILNAEVVEYTEAGAERKIIIWNYDITDMDKKAYVTLSDQHKACNEWIDTELGFKDLIDGEYLNGKEKSSYFFDFKEMLNAPYDFNAHGKIDTISPLVKKLAMQ